MTSTERAARRARRRRIAEAQRRVEVAVRAEFRREAQARFDTTGLPRGFRTFA